MNSVRVRRGQYTTLQDVFPEQQPARPRARSAAQPPDSSQPAERSLADLPARSTLPRRRSNTLDGADLLAPSTQRRTLRRPPSKVSDHIMSSMRSPRLESATLRNDDTRARRDAMQTPPPRQESRPPRTSDVISLQGSTENIIYHGDGQHLGRIGSAFGSMAEEGGDEEQHHSEDIVEHLDVIDPTVATVSTLTNAANAIVFPPLSFYSRKCTIVLPDIPRRTDALGHVEEGRENEDDLDRHVEDILSKKDKWKRIMRGVWTFMKTPMGIIVSIYGFLIIFWGAGIVFFLGKFVNFHNANTQGFWVELCQQVETGLFTATSIGLIPFRVLDTWRVSRIYRWKQVTTKRRRQAGLPDLYDPDDLPDPAYDENYVHVLTEKEQADLHYQQHKFMQSMTWYRPHGTSTHRAFPINLALWICIMNDLNSFFQCLLSGCMWGLNRFQRPAWTTATTLPAAFVAGILAGVFIWWGSKKTRRHAQVEQRLRAALAMDSESKPSITDTTVEGTDFPAANTSNGKLAPSDTATEDSTPTLRVLATPRCKDFAEIEAIEEKNGELQCEKEVDRIHPIQRESVGSVPISERMTVPPAEIVHPEHPSPSPS